LLSSVSLVNFQTNKPIKNFNAKVFRMKKAPFALKHGMKISKMEIPFKKLLLTANAENNDVT